MIADAERREAQRRRDDNWRIWLPLILSLVTMLFTIGVMYGKLDGRLELIEYRMFRIERALNIPGP